MQIWLRKASGIALTFALLVGGCSTARQAAEEVEEQGEAAADAIGIPDDDASLVGVANSDGNFDTLVEAIQATGLTQQLQQDGPYTIFAPTDDAFADMPDRDGMMTESNREELRALLLNHTVEGDVSASEVMELSSVETLYGNTLRVRRRAGNVYIGGAQVIETDIEAENGRIHAVNQVIR